MTMHLCQPCKQRHIERVATHVLDTPKKGEWYLCNQHAVAVAKTLYGSFTNIRPLTREEYTSGNTPKG